MAASKQRRPKPSPKAATEVDRALGATIRRLRKAAGLSQMAVAQQSGITFQQLQKYEKGTNRISVSRLLEIAATLGVPITDFFDDLPEPVKR
jgi:transcriptional regulator with XRE-family HTH domain